MIWNKLLKIFKATPLKEPIYKKEKYDDESYMIVEGSHVAVGIERPLAEDFLSTKQIGEELRKKRQEEENIQFVKNLIKLFTPKEEEEEKAKDIMTNITTTIFNTTDNLKDKVERIMYDFANSNTSFTSLDVSNKVKQEGFPDVRHREVADIVKALFFQDDILRNHNYIKSNIDVFLETGKPTIAFLYHNINVPKTDYQTTNLVPIKPISKDAVPAVISTPFFVNTILNDADDDEENYEEVLVRQKSDCRLEIPMSVLKKVNWTGDTIYATFDPVARIIVLKNNDSNIHNFTFLGQIQKSADGRVRVYKKIFDKTGLHHEPKQIWSVETDNCFPDSIFICAT